MTVTVRFAPSPTGFLHAGNARTALMNQLLVLKNGGRFILRLDDTDLERSEAKFVAAIEDDLAWLGFRVDEKVHQSDRFDRYDAAAEGLKTAGLLYPCYETGDELERKRKLQRAQGLPPVYDRAALKLSDEQRAAYEAEGRKPHWRFKLSHEPVAWDDLVRGPQSIETSAISDPILIREDGSYLYTLPSVVDDIDLAITHVVRGEDHVTNSGAQIEIFEALGGTAPSFAHTPLLVGAEGDKLSKRLSSLSLMEFRERGIEPMALCSLLAKIGTSDAVEARADMETLAAEFDFAKIGRAPARFDEAELLRLNAALLRDTPFEAVEERLAAAGVGGGAAFWEAARANVETVEDAKDLWSIVDGKVTPVIAAEDVTSAAAALVPDGDLTAESWSQLVAAVKEKTGAKGKGLFQPLRLALTGREHGPEMDKLFVLIGAEKARARLKGETA
ncbi:MAG: glutamate--tRNA ligase [Maricaulaceae bacterium]|jgi:glutamyl-tRNA synthetase